MALDVNPQSDPEENARRRALAGPGVDLAAAWPALERDLLKRARKYRHCESDDLVQAVAEALFTAQPDLGDLDHLARYANTVMRNKAIDLARAQRDSMLLDPALDDRATAPSAEATALHRVALEAIDASLTDAERALLDDIPAAAGHGRQTVANTRRHRLRNRLRAVAATIYGLVPPWLRPETWFSQPTQKPAAAAAIAAALLGLGTLAGVGSGDDGRDRSGVQAPTTTAGAARLDDAVRATAERPAAASRGSDVPSEPRRPSDRTAAPNGDSEQGPTTSTSVIARIDDPVGSTTVEEQQDPAGYRLVCHELEGPGQWSCIYRPAPDEPIRDQLGLP